MRRCRGRRPRCARFAALQCTVSLSRLAQYMASERRRAGKRKRRGTAAEVELRAATRRRVQVKVRTLARRIRRVLRIGDPATARCWRGSAPSSDLTPFADRDTPTQADWADTLGAKPPEPQWPLTRGTLSVQRAIRLRQAAAEPELHTLLLQRLWRVAHSCRFPPLTPAASAHGPAAELSVRPARDG